MLLTVLNSFLALLRTYQSPGWVGVAMADTRLLRVRGWPPVAGSPKLLLSSCQGLRKGDWEPEAARVERQYQTDPRLLSLSRFKPCVVGAGTD
ncbi:hypothetical protein F4859DRAFT_497073 [Xylaria cf. heliscus]|nr:hypothetical protein F4859DRAFT_497073 [Xylaria cf. heliscus]